VRSFRTIDEAAVAALARRRRGGWTSKSVKNPPLNVFIEKSADSPSRKEAKSAKWVEREPLRGSRFFGSI
jgi:hypothetical protein